MNSIFLIYLAFRVDQHSGGLNGGHYTAVCKNSLDEQWYNFNDSCVGDANMGRICTPEAYVLFYRRRGSVESKLALQGGEVSSPGSSPSSSWVDVKHGDDEATFTQESY